MPTVSPQATAAARLLWQRRCDGSVIEALPAELRPTNAAEGDAIQAALPAVAGQAVAGWKIAATSVAGQQHINVPGPLAGRILAGTLLADGAAVSLSGNRMRVVEPELAFRFARALAPRVTAYSVDEVLAAVDALHLALEIPDSRYAQFTRAGAPQLIADDACAWRFVFGADAPPVWRTIDLASHRVDARVIGADGELRYTRSGDGSAVLGDPRAALAWLVNELSARGITLHAGESVSTGTCMVPLEIVPGDRVEVDYGVLGRMTLQLLN
jgi:2-keto-4-pentenoate hydratase